MEHPHLYSYFFVNGCAWMFHEKNILMLYEYLIIVFITLYYSFIQHYTSLSIT